MDRHEPSASGWTRQTARPCRLRPNRIARAAIPVLFLLAFGGARASLDLREASADFPRGGSDGYPFATTLAVAGPLTDAGEPALALRTLDAALEDAPRDAQLLALRGYALLRLGRLAEAEDALRDALALRPDEPGARYALGAVLAGLGRRQEALAELLEERRTHPDAATRVRCFLDAAELEAALGWTTEAENDALEAVRLDPARSDAWGLVARLRLHGGRVDEALAAAREATDGGAGDYRLAFLLGAALADRGDWAGARDQFESAVRSRPAFAPAWKALAAARRHLGKQDAAVEAAERYQDLVKVHREPAVTADP